MRTTCPNLHSPDELVEEFSPELAPMAEEVHVVEDSGESIAHDLNNVLSLITMATELLGSLEIGKEQRRFLQIIEDGTARGQGVSRRLFEFVKGLRAQ